MTAGALLGTTTLTALDFTSEAAHIDFETRSTTDLKKSGVARYVEDPETRPWLFSWRIGKYGPMQRWNWGDPDPQPLLDHIRAGRRVTNHNAAFERTVWNEVCVREMPWWPLLRIEQQDDTMARAAALALPLSLDMLAKVLKAPVQKDMEGNRLMKQMMRPRSYNADGTITWWDDAERIARLGDYCDTDVEAETSVDELLLPLSEWQRASWVMDQRINERGIKIDIRAVEKLVHVVELAKKAADVAMRQLSGREVKKCSDVKGIIAFLNKRGIATDSLRKQDQEDLMYMADLHGSEVSRQVIELRRASSKTSTAKYAAMLACVSADGRIRNLLQWHGAGTGRKAGRLVQPQNFPRVDADSDEPVKIAWLHELINSDRNPREIVELIEAVYGPLEPLALLSKALRSMFIAALDCVLIDADFANIEGRVNAWLAGEEWKLEAFRAYDRKEGPDLYRVAYSRAFGTALEAITKAMRQLGKVMELFLGFQGSIGAFFGPTSNVDPYKVEPVVRAATTPEQWERTRELYHKKGTNRFGLEEAQWTALKILVDNWRASNPKIVASWWEYQDAAIEAVASPGTVVACVGGKVAYYCDGRSLWCVLPSGRMLHYSSPELEQTWVEYEGFNADGSPKGRWKRSVTVEGYDGTTKQWVRYSLYGGIQCENIVQAVAFDLMEQACMRVEDAGYPVVLTVHDEILAEVKKQDVRMRGLGVEKFAQLMGQGEPWSVGLPIAVDAWMDIRYVK